MRTAIVVGNPKPASRTLEAATLVGAAIAGHPPDVVVDAVTLGAGLLGSGDAGVAGAVDAVRSARLAVVASPTYKASFTGVLKAFLDQFPTDGLRGIVAVPLMLGAGPAHALAPEVFLRPVLVELGATCPTRACYLLESGYAGSDAAAVWLESARPALAPLLDRP